jgi:cardiolipin synthase A/B
MAIIDFSLFTQIIKKISIAILILLLASTLYVLAKDYPHSQPTQLPNSNASIELYSNQTQDDLTHLFFQAIDNAKESITLIIYALTDPLMIQTLQKKSDAGVQIYIVVDGKASAAISHNIPRATIVKRYKKGLMHQKILVIDNKQIWLGSANFTTHSLALHGNLVMGIENPALAQALTTRAKSMDDEGGYDPLLHHETTSGPQNLELWVLPDHPNAAERMFELFRSAQKCIKVAMFTWTRTDFAEELIAAAKRGVKVEIVIDRYSGRGASAKIVRMLEREGIPALLHHKFAYIDDTILVNGSTNWTNLAFKENDDYFIVLYPVTPEQQAKMNKLWSVILKDSEQEGRKK